MTPTHDPANQLKGYFFAFIAISLWAGWSIVTRIGALSPLTTMDMAFMRFTCSGILMFPIAYKNRHLVTKQNFKNIFLMTLGAGIAYFSFMAQGFRLAPAGHGIITPCTMSTMVAIASYYMYGEKFSKIRVFGYCLIIFGLALKLYNGVLGGTIWADIFFVIGALTWSIYTIQTKGQKQIPAIAAAAFVQVGSMALIFFPYLAYQIHSPHSLPIGDSVLQIIYQGFFTGIVSLIFFNKALELIGASATASVAAAMPAMITVLAIPFLHEYPSKLDIVFVTMMTVGVFIASGAVKIRKAKK